MNSVNVENLSNEKSRAAFVLLTASTVLLIGIFFIVYFNEIRIEKTTASVSHVLMPSAFANIKIEANAAFVFDAIDGGVLYSKNADSRLPLASIAKVMTALVLSKEVEKFSEVTISSKAVSTLGDSGLKVGDKWDAKTLLQYSLVTSSNDGIMALAESFAEMEFTEHKNDVQNNPNNTNAITKAMNEKAQELGLSQTYFFNPTGLDESSSLGGAYGSARDVGILFARALKDSFFTLADTAYEMTEFTSLKMKYFAENTDEAVDGIPGIIAGKTGFTDLAGGNLVVAFAPEPNKIIIAVVLGSSREGRFSDMKQLVRASLVEIAKN